MKLFENIMMVMLLSCAALSSDLSAMTSDDLSADETWELELSSAMTSGDLSADETWDLKLSRVIKSGGASSVHGAGEAKERRETGDPESPIAAAAGGGRESRIGYPKVINLLLEEMDYEWVGLWELLQGHLSEEDASVIVKKCRYSKKLNFSWRYGVAEFISGLPVAITEWLEEVGLAYATVEDVFAIIQRCPNLKMLNLRGCRGASRFIERLQEGVELQLEELNLAGTDASPDQVRRIVELCPRLKKLNLHGCRGAARVIASLPVDIERSLECLVLNLEDFSGINEMRTRFPECEIYYSRGYASGEYVLPYSSLQGLTPMEY